MSTQNFRSLYIKDYNELYKYLNNSLSRIKPSKGEPFKTLMKRKLSTSYQIIHSELERVSTALNTIKNSGLFYIELFKVYTSEDIDNLLGEVKKRSKQLRSIYKWALEELRKVESKREVLRAFKAGVGRMLSIYRRVNKRIIMVKNYLVEVSKMPDIRGDYVVVLAGLPQVGKSTLLSKLTRARPEIGSYPFTTKTIIAGHVDVEPYGRIVILDSPGILDTPIEEKNIIEYKAILALKHLADHVLFIFTHTPGFYYTLQEQLDVYKSVKKIIGEKPITVLINKIDLIDSEYLEKLVKEIEEYTGVKPLPISALTGYNLDKLREILVNALMEKMKRP